MSPPPRITRYANSFCPEADDISPPSIRQALEQLLSRPISILAPQPSMAYKKAAVDGTTCGRGIKTLGLATRIIQLLAEAAPGIDFSGYLAESITASGAPSVVCNTLQYHEPSLQALRAFSASIYEFRRRFRYTHQGSARFIDFLDFSDHITAIAILCPQFDQRFMVVRDEYQLAMEAFEHEQGIYSKGACVIGQPGIGETSFLIYALIERICKGKPVSLQIDADFYVLFVGGNVTIHPTSAPLPVDLKGLWALSDSNDVVTTPAAVFRRVPGIRIFQTTSPHISRWKEWSKQLGVHPYIMDVWSIEEIRDLGTLLGLQDVNQLVDLAGLWGGAPRTLLTAIRSPNPSSFQLDMAIEANSAVLAAPNYIPALQTLSLRNLGPSSMFFIRPSRPQWNDKKFYRLRPIVYIPTLHVATLLGSAARRQSAKVQVAFFHIMGNYFPTRSTCGVIFEPWCHSLFISGQLLEMKWHANGRGRNPKSRLQTASNLVSTKDLPTAKPPFYWIPDSSTFPGIDGAFFTGREVYAIQATIASTTRRRNLA